MSTVAAQDTPHAPRVLACAPVPTLPDALPIRTRSPLDATVRVPGSKSVTNRALLAAALAPGESRIRGGLDSDDTQVMRRALEALGADIDESLPDSWGVRGCDGRFRAPSSGLYVGGSGTAARFLCAAATLAEGPVSLDGDPRMRERPIGDLADALRALGADLEFEGSGECPPLTVRGGGLAGGHIEMDARKSSQYVSAVLLAAPYAQRDITLHFAEGIVVSRPYVDLTLQVMAAFGARAHWLETHPDEIAVLAGIPYRASDFQVEPDASAAVYAFCAAAIAGGGVRVEGLPRDSIQADLALLPILETMGCTVGWDDSGVVVERGERPLNSPGTIDMNALPDAAMALAVVALFADGPTRLTNIANLRIKETDRLQALENELRRLGAEAHAGADSLEIVPGPTLSGAAIETYDDHRMAMSFALAGLKLPGLVIQDPACVSKTWPDFFSALESL